jgi:hypothetical protein
MKLFIVAFYILLAVTSGFQPLLATKMMTPPIVMKKAMDAAPPNIATGIMPTKIKVKKVKVVAPVETGKKGPTIVPKKK